MEKMRLKLNNFFKADKKGRKLNLSLKGGGGFTLIELITAIGIFSVVIIIVGGIFMAVFFGNRRILALQNLQDNVRFTVESISREIRVGKNFDNSVANQLSFTNSTGQLVVYRLNNNALERSENGVGGTFFPMTDSSIIVSSLNFYLQGSGAGDGFQPRVTFTIRAQAQVGTQSAAIDVQTTLSQRLLQS